jgi:hypothetical protein
VGIGGNSNAHHYNSKLLQGCQIVANTEIQQQAPYDRTIHHHTDMVLPQIFHQM